MIDARADGDSQVKQPVILGDANRRSTVLLFLRRVDCNDGVASYCETMVKGLNARGHRVVIVSGPVTQLYGSAARHDAILENTLEWVTIDDLITARPKLSTIRSVLATIRKHSVDVISPQGFSLIPLSYLLARLARLPVVANYHPSMHGASADMVATSRSLKMRLGYKAIAKLCRADRFIAISKEIVAFFRKDCEISEGRIAYIPHGIDMSFFRPPTQSERESARRALSLPESALVCVLPGRISFVKGHDIVIDAVRILRKTKPALDVVCLFPGGAGADAPEIQSYALKTDADIAAFRFLGFLYANAFRECYWAADIVLLPSRFEGFGLVIAEAMSCGCVPIRTPSGGSEDQIVDDVNGFLIPFNDPQALADRIAALSEPSVKARMRENALSYATQHFDQEAMVAATSDLYQRAVGVP